MELAAASVIRVHPQALTGERSHLFVPDDVALCASDVIKTSFFLLTLIVFMRSSNFSNTLALFLIQFEKMLQARYDSKVYFVAI